MDPRKGDWEINRLILWATLVSANVQGSIEIWNPISRNDQLNAPRGSGNFPDKAYLLQSLYHAMTGRGSSPKVLLEIGLRWRFPVYLCVIVDERQILSLLVCWYR
ncbi:MAG: hypothetical protein ACI9R3_001317 [Verrucomicrobiales bacterium]|jgi:hypothetical protein